MSGLSSRQNTKQRLLRGACAFTLAALVGLFSPGVSAANDSQLWSVVIHIEYVSGFEYEITFATGVPTSSLPSILEYCGSAHGTNRGVIRYHCYPVPE
jgi:hypothetical protein